MANKRPGRNKRPGWKIYEKIISVLDRLSVLGGEFWKITVIVDQNFRQFNFSKKFQVNDFHID